MWRRVLGWSLIGLGVAIVAWVAYEQLVTTAFTAREQTALREQFERGDFEPVAAGSSAGPLGFDVPTLDVPTLAVPAPDVAMPEARPSAVSLGTAYAALWFERPGSSEPPVHDEALYLVEGVGLGQLTRGPGHYPSSAAPGQEGNFAVAGHRTTYGAPFFHLDKIRPGDEIHVLDRDKREWVYDVVEQRIVDATALWVVGADPLGTGRPTLTLTTCHPRYSSQQRLIVFAELR